MPVGEGGGECGDAGRVYRKDRGNREGESGKGQPGGETGREAKGRGRRRDMRKGDFIDGYDGMSGWT